LSQKQLIRPYGDRKDDGVIQISFVLPVPASEKAKEAAALVAKKLGLSHVLVAAMEKAGEGYSFFVVYGRTHLQLDFASIEVPVVAHRKHPFDELNDVIERDPRRVLATRPDGAGRLLHRRLRTLCEDLDERLGTVAEAVRQHRITAAAGLLGDAVTIAGELASYLSAARPAHADAMHPATERLHEADVLRTLVRVRALDDELHRAARGEGDGDGSLRAGALLAEIRTLAGAARSEAAAPCAGVMPG